MRRRSYERAARPSPPIHGVDFTSAPRAAKPITVASGYLLDDAFHLDRIEEIRSFDGFEHWLRRPGPWIAGFDFPFGFPRQALLELGWPLDWPELARHCAALGRARLRLALDAHRAGRPAGSKFCYRRGDAAAGAHSPLKLVNPPVALMLLEGASRLVQAGVSIPGMHAADPERIALEAYPGFAVRQLLASRVRVSYKNDAPGRQTPAQRSIRGEILRRVASDASPFGFRLLAKSRLTQEMRADGRGDLLDAMLCALQAAWGWQRRNRAYGLPAGVDPVEGWIVTVPAPAVACS